MDRTQVILGFYKERFSKSCVFISTDNSARKREASCALVIKTSKAMENKTHMPRLQSFTCITHGSIQYHCHLSVSLLLIKF